MRFDFKTVATRLLLAMCGLVGFSAVALTVYNVWLSQVVDNNNNAAEQPVWLACLLCILMSCLLGCLQSGRLWVIMVSSFAGLLFGFLLLPGSSVANADRVEAILAGDLTEFLPVSLCVGSFIGTLVGQNLVELRVFINAVNRRSPKILKNASDVSVN